MIENLIISICVTLNGDPSLIKYYHPCTKVLTAASIQTHVKPQFETVQHYYEKKTVDPITEVTGEKMWFLAGFIHTTLIKQKIEFTTSFKPIADNLRLQADDKSENLVLTWTF